MSSLIVEVLSGSSQGLVVPFTRPLLIGSDPQAGLVLRDAGVDRRHAEMTLEKGQLWIRDLGSVAGTYLGSQRLGQNFVAFPPGSAVRCAGVRFRVRPGSAAQTAPGSGRVRGSQPPAPASGRLAGSGSARQHFPKLAGPGRGPTPSRPFPRPKRAPAPSAARVPGPGPVESGQGLLVNLVVDLASGQCLGLKAHTPELEGIDRDGLAATVIAVHAQLAALEGALAEPGAAGQFRVESAQATFFLRRFEDDALFVLLATRGYPAEAGWQNLSEAYARFSQLDIKRPQPAAPVGNPKISATGFLNLLALEKQDPGLLADLGAPAAPPAATPSSSRRLASARLTLGAQLMGARNDAGMTVRAAATRLGVDRKEWTLWERGARGIPERYRAAIVQMLPGAAEFLQ